MNPPKKPKKSAEIIKGPWPESDIKISDINGLQVVEDLKFADSLTEAIMVQMLSTFKENDFDTSGEMFSGDVGFMIEVIKSVIYRSMGYEHPLHGFMGDVLDVTEIVDGENVHYNTSINMELLAQVSDFVNINIEDDDGPELA